MTLVISFTLILFISPSLSQGALAFSPIDSRANIPISIPIETERISDSESQHDITDYTSNHSAKVLHNDDQRLVNDISALLTCGSIPVTSVTAIGNDGNVPSNVIDKDFNTRWSNNGVGSWIQLDLGSKKSICSVDIAWYRGDMRQNNFVISVSDNGNTFTNKFTGTSSGTTTSFEKYTLPAGTEGRYVRITVNGNTENNWASITEIAVHGEGGVVPPPPTINPGPLYHKWQSSAGSTTSWSAYQSLGGASTGKTAIGLNSDGRLQVFVIGTNNALYYKTQTSAGSSTWTGWVSLGGAVKENASPEVERNSDGRLQVFVVGMNDQLYYKTQTSAGSTTWSGWQSLGGALRSNTDPAVIANGDGRLQVFVVGTNNALYYKTQTSVGSSSWTSVWQSLGGGVKENASPAVARNSDGRLDVFAVGTNNQLIHKWQNSAGSSSWSAYQSLGGIIRQNTSPAVASNADGRLDVFVVGSNNALYHKWQTSAGSSTWSAYQTLGGAVKANTDPVVIPNSNGRLEVFVIGTNNQLYHKWQTSAGSSTWSAHHSLGGHVEGDPSAARNADGRLEAFVVGRSTGGGGGGDSGTNDQFGIRKIYSSKPGGEQWFMNMQDPTNDPRTSEPSMSRNSDGSWRVTSGQVRYGVFTSSGYQPGNVVKDHSIIANRGYMQSPNDWKNIEMTGQVKYNSGGDDEWTWYARGGRHTGSGNPDGCEGSSLKGSLAYTGGQVRWAKEQWHVSYVFQPWKNSPADGDGQFVGFKVVMYNMQLDGKTVVKMESWVDPNNNNQWQKVYDFTDQGGWGSQGGECNGAPDQIITWGGPIAAFRWDDGNSIDIKNLSVREIIPPTS